MIMLGPGTVIAGRYALTRLLGRGGMGSVWLARHRDLDLEVAVKFMAPALVASTDARMRFEREAKVAAPLRSRHIVQVRDYGIEDATPYIILELLEGESLATRLARSGPLTLPVAAGLLVQICRGLGAAHAAGLVHRDLKPGNIFIAVEDQAEVVKVLDFGIAKDAGHGEASMDTATGMMLGSAHYMSPEQIRSSKEVDHRSDLWSMGILLYRMLTGYLPYAGPGVDVGDVLVRVCTGSYPLPSSVVPGLPASIDSFFERALDRIPEHRFQSALELAEVFQALAHAPLPRPMAKPGDTILILPDCNLPAMRAEPVLRDGGPTRPYSDPHTAKMQPAAPPVDARALRGLTADTPTTNPPPCLDTDGVTTSGPMIAGARPQSSPILPPTLPRRRLRYPATVAVALVAAAGFGMALSTRGSQAVLPVSAALGTAAVAPTSSASAAPMVPTTGVVPGTPQSPTTSVAPVPTAPKPAPAPPVVKPTPKVPAPAPVVRPHPPNCEFCDP